MMMRRHYYYLILLLLLGILVQGVFAQEQPAKAPAAPAPEEEAPPLINIKAVDDKEQFYSVELRDVEIRDLFRVLAQDYKLNLLIDKDVKGTVTASFNNISLEEMLEAIAQSNNLALEKEKNIINIKPNLITKVFVLNNIEAKKIIQAQQAAQQAAAGGQQQQAQGAAAQGQAATVNTIFDLLSEKGKVFLGEQPNSIMVIDYPANVARIEEYLKIADQKMVARVFKLKYISVTDIFPEMVDKDREERKKQRDERQQETEEIKSLQPQSSSGQ